MKNLKKIACLVALSPIAFAAEVAVSSSLAVVNSEIAQHDTNSNSLTGLMAGVSYYEPTSDNAGLYGSANVFLSPAMLSEGGPRIANIQVGGTFSAAPGSKVKMGLVGQAASSSNAAGDVAYTTGFQFGGLYELQPGIDVECALTSTFPMSSATGSPSTAVSLGVSKSIDVLG